MTDFLDPPNLADAAPAELLADDLERTAIALWNLAHIGPEDLGVLVARGDPSLVKAWRGPGVDEATRHLYRRRAAIVVAVHAGKLRPEHVDPLLSDGYPGGFASDNLVESLYDRAASDEGEDDDDRSR